MPGFQINPSAAELWNGNAVVSGRNVRYRVAPMEGTLSIKTVLAGSGVWETPDGRYEVSPETCLVLNDGQTYSLEIDYPSVVQTFCVFFRRNFVEEAAASQGVRGSIGFYERLRLKPDAISGQLHRLRLLWHEGSNETLEADEAMVEMAVALVRSETAPKEQAGLEHAKASTREEVFRQLNRSRDYALTRLNDRLSLDELASIAFMSPFHFHRLHGQAFGETPHEFVTRARLKRATRMLEEGAEVGDVSIAVGFESVPTFTRLFKFRIGCTPGAFRKIG